MTITEFLTARLDEESRFWANPSAMRFGGVGLSDLILRMRADIAAKRAILAEFQRDPMALHSSWGLALEWVLRRQVQPYAEHPDFDPAWKM